MHRKARWLPILIPISIPRRFVLRLKTSARPKRARLQTQRWHRMAAHNCTQYPRTIRTGNPRRRIHVSKPGVLPLLLLLFLLVLLIH